jgi:hypothetical protein
VNIFPGRNQRGEDPYANVARGEQVSADMSRSGVVDDGSVAWEERIVEARRSWPQANPADFERVGKRTYIDKATGVEYVTARGAVMLNIGGEQNRGINCFFVAGGRLIFLRRPEFEAPLHGPVGHVHAQQVTPATPGPEGPRIL